MAQAGGFGYCVATGKTKRCSSLQSVAVINVPVTPTSHTPSVLHSGPKRKSKGWS